jgi:hypothetical protein
MGRQAAATRTKRRRSPRPSIHLKIAIIQSRIPQFVIAEKLRISIFRLSRIVCGRQQPTQDEQDRLAKILKEPRLFSGTTP